jgi:hypothetical protein
MANALTLVQTITALADGTGSCTFPPQGSGNCLTGSLAIVNASSGVQYTVTVGGQVVVPNGQGANLVGSIQALPAQTVLVEAINLVPGQQYQVNWTVSVTDPASTPSVVPMPQSTSILSVNALDELILDTTNGVFPALLESISYPVPPNDDYTALNATVTALNPYSTLVVIINPVSLPGSYAVQVVNATKGLVSSWQTLSAGTTAIVPVYLGAGPYPTTAPLAYFNTPADAGDQLAVLVCQVTGAIEPNSINLGFYGFGEAIRPNPLRQDGRCLPQSSQAASAELSTTGTQSMVGVTSPARVLLGSAGISVVTATNQYPFFIQGTIAGISEQVMIGPGSNGAVALEWPQGLLFDPGAGVNFVSSAGAGAVAYATITYDVIV